MSQLTLTSDPLGSATTGTLEFTNPAFYLTPATSQRGVVHADQFILQQATYTLTSQTAAQKLFNAVSNGTVTLVAGTYEFDCMFSLSSMSATSGSFGFALGGAATFTQYWWSNANKATLATAAGGQVTYNTAANTAIATATTATVAFARCGGGGRRRVVLQNPRPGRQRGRFERQLELSHDDHHRRRRRHHLPRHGPADQRDDQHRRRTALLRSACLGDV